MIGISTVWQDDTANEGDKCSVCLQGITGTKWILMLETGVKNYPETYSIEPMNYILCEKCYSEADK